MDRIHIQFTRFSAFYSPLIVTFAGGFLEAEGLDASHSVAPPGTSAVAAALDGSAQVVQSSVSQSFSPIERGERPPFAHFALINACDGFLLTGRAPEPDFEWGRLAGRTVLVDHGGQPLAMFKYACHRMGVDYDAIEAVDAGGVDAIDGAFRAGEGDYVHQQGPSPQQLVHDGVGHIVASVGEAIGPLAFSSLAARRDWLEADAARAFTRAYAAARRHVNETPAAALAELKAPFFPGIDADVLADTIGYYQGLGCWPPALAIGREAYEVTVDVFRLSGAISGRPAYDDAVVPPPGAV